jgi:FMN reductase
MPNTPPQETQHSGPLVVGLGGTTRASSSTERVLRHCLDEVAELGARTMLFSASDLDLPIYAPERAGRHPKAQALIEALRRADGVIIATPGYHGGMSGMVKNALDYVEDLRDDERPYLDGRPVGCIVCAYGWQATTTTLVNTRLVIHALRGWPTPLGVVVNSAEPIWADTGSLADPGIATQLRILAGQVVEFAQRSMAHTGSGESVGAAMQPETEVPDEIHFPNVSSGGGEV